MAALDSMIKILPSNSAIETDASARPSAAIVRAQMRLALLILLAITCSGAQGQDAWMDLAIACDEPNSRFYLAQANEMAAEVNSWREKGLTVEVFSSDELVVYSEEDPKRRVRYRLKSRSATRTCGQVSARITAGWLNADPLREQGAVPFPIVRLYASRSRLAGPISIGECSTKIPIYSYGGSCPSRWAVLLVVKPKPGGGWTVSIERKYD